MKNISDEKLAAMAQNHNSGAEEFLIGKYKGLVRLKSRSYFLIGADREDVMQEGMIGLFKAIRDFDASKTASFMTFADMCITRQIISAIKSATSKKHIPLNSYVSLSKPDDDSMHFHVGIVSDSKTCASPEEILISQESKNMMEINLAEKLSSLEFQVLSLYLQGLTYQEIAQIIDRGEKSVDNAIQRIRKKVEEIIPVAYCNL